MSRPTNADMQAPNAKFSVFFLLLLLFSQLLYCFVCWKLLWPVRLITGALVMSRWIRTSKQPMVRYCGCTKRATAYRLICKPFTKCIHVPMCSECNMDQGSCGCCLMLQKMHSLRTYFNVTLNKLEKGYLHTEQCFNNIQGE